MAVFSWIPDTEPTGDRAPRINSHGYGDGYEQRYQDGLNGLAQVWDVSFSRRTLSEAEAIDAFLAARGAVENFDWTPPLTTSTLGRYICKSWQIVRHKGSYGSVSARFEQVFDNS